MFPNAKTKLSWYSDYQSFSCRKNLFSWHNNFFLAVESNFLLQENNSCCKKKYYFGKQKKKLDHSIKKIISWHRNHICGSSFQQFKVESNCMAENTSNLPEATILSVSKYQN